MAQLVNFAIVFFILYRYALKPLGKLMNDRKQTIEQGLQDAAANAALITETKAIFEQERIRAQEEAQQLLHNMKADIEQKRTLLLSEAHTQAEKIVTESRLLLEQEKKAVLQDAHKEIAGLVIQATEKILSQLPDQHMQKQLIEKAVQEFSV